MKDENERRATYRAGYNAGFIVGVRYGGIPAPGAEHVPAPYEAHAAEYRDGHASGYEDMPAFEAGADAGEDAARNSGAAPGYRTRAARI